MNAIVKVNETSVFYRIAQLLRPDMSNKMKRETNVEWESNMHKTHRANKCSCCCNERIEKEKDEITTSKKKKRPV